ncbi:MAG TPA: Rv2231c family pyridoxal phosphate-dependent protein CobC [Jatrophihabitans sp.]
MIRRPEVRTPDPWRDADIVVGVGSRFGVTVPELRSLLDLALDRAGLAAAEVTALATVKEKATEQALVALAAELSLPIRAYTGAELAQISVQRPSLRVQAATGTPSVAEAAALLGANRGVRPSPYRVDTAVELLVGKVSSARATVAVARRTTVNLLHHGDAELEAGLLDLAVNVSAEPRPDWLDAAILAACTQLSAYPNPAAASTAVAARHCRSADEVLLTAGAAEAFTLIAHGIASRIPGTSGPLAVVVHPQFTEPEVALRTANWQIERLTLSSTDGFVLDPDRVPDNADLVVIGNPTNPTGTQHTADVIRSLIRPGRVVLVDEAFMDSVPGEPESVGNDADLTGLLVTRSLTKTWGLAGLRIGYLLGDRDLIRRLARVQPHWSVSSPALAAAVACMSEEAQVVTGIRATALVRQRSELRDALYDRGFEVPDISHGPFLLTRHRDRPSLHSELRQARIAVRRADTFPGLGPGWVRIAVRDETATQTLLAAIDATAATSNDESESGA